MKIVKLESIKKMTSKVAGRSGGREEKMNEWATFLFLINLEHAFQAKFYFTESSENLSPFPCHIMTSFIFPLLPSMPCFVIN